jgi:HPt (histidine-containing phosphotransfer) domain-containing protein
MNPAMIDPHTFDELQANAGADFVRELVDTFAEEAPRLLAELRSALASGAAERFRRAAHSLKSNSHTFGATRLAAMARALELAGLPPDAGALDALVPEIDATVAALQALARR